MLDFHTPKYYCYIMVDITNELIYQVLQKIQGDISGIKHEIKEMKASITGLREQLHAAEGNYLRQERLMAGLDLRVERIEHRLNLNDA